VVALSLSRLQMSVAIAHVPVMEIAVSVQSECACEHCRLHTGCWDSQWLMRGEGVVVE